MEVRAEVLEKSIKRSTLTSNLVSIFLAIVTALGVGFGFYYNTKNQIDNHEKSIKAIEKDVEENQKKVNEIYVFKGVSSTEMKNLEQKVDKIDEKLDKLIMLQQNN